MHPELDSIQPARTELAAQDLQLLIPVESRSRVFLQNLEDLFRQRSFSKIESESSPGTFWPDVFIDPELPLRGFAQSVAFHIFALIVIWIGSRIFLSQPRVTSQSAFNHADVVYYSPSEYLPPLDTRRASPGHATKADPEYSPQPIISLPREADNHVQTTVAAPKVKLNHDLALPNSISLIEKIPSDQRMPIAPAPIIAASQKTRLTPQMERTVIAPAPDVSIDGLQKGFHAEAAVIAPPPSMETDSRRKLGDLDIARTSVIAPAPQLTLSEQRAVRGRTSTVLNGGSNIIPPPPSAVGSGRNTLALNLHPAVGAPPDPPTGNRRGNFAATPEGHRGATGSPATTTGKSKENGSESGANKSAGLPSGLYVGKASNSASATAGEPGAKASSGYSVNPNLIANAKPPRVAARAMQPEAESKLSEEERNVFGSRKFYSLSLNMPNLNSAGGSWIIRFAAKKADAPADSLSHAPVQPDASSADLSAPSATRKVDPAYPLELMRQNVAGTVILYAVIHADGTVGNVRVLRSVDERLDRFASAAIAKWQFQPATKNGAPVDVEATFWIPFRPIKTDSSF